MKDLDVDGVILPEGQYTYVCVCFARVALLVWHETRRHFVICRLCDFTIFFDILINGTIFREKVPEHKICVLIFSTTFISNISHSKTN